MKLCGILDIGQWKWLEWRVLGVLCFRSRLSRTTFCHLAKMFFKSVETKKHMWGTSRLQSQAAFIQNLESPTVSDYAALKHQLWYVCWCVSYNLIFLTSKYGWMGQNSNHFKVEKQKVIVFDPINVRLDIRTQTLMFPKAAKQGHQ